MANLNTPYLGGSNFGECWFGASALIPGVVIPPPPVSPKPPTATVTMGYVDIKDDNLFVE
jgi:hypothetical protein